MTNFELRSIKNPDALQSILNQYFWFNRHTNKFITPLSVRLQDEVIFVQATTDKEGTIQDFTLDELTARKKTFFLNAISSCLNYNGNDYEAFCDLESIAEGGEYFAIKLDQIWIVRSKEGNQYLVTVQLTQDKDVLVIQRLQRIIHQP